METYYFSQCTHTHTCVHTHTHTVNSDVFKELDEVMKEVFGVAGRTPPLTSLPLVGDLQEAGFNEQVGHVIVM